jgi:hypothetical protein
VAAYKRAPSRSGFWFWRRVFTTSIGKIADVPMIPANAPTANLLARGIFVIGGGACVANESAVLG